MQEGRRGKPRWITGSFCPQEDFTVYQGECDGLGAWTCLQEEPGTPTGEGVLEEVGETAPQLSGVAKIPVLPRKELGDGFHLVNAVNHLIPDLPSVREGESMKYALVRK